ncbi:MAG TPA: hypothetical protein VFQ95_03175 [Rhodanobacteraceae bacterium]|nr:hypothetical protein [Rhodanobacteraceae bacterium]
MREFFASLRDICLFRSGPDDLPYAPRVLIALLVAGAAVEALMGSRTGAAAGALAGAVVGGFAAVGMLWLLLRSRGKAERFVQTTTALAAVYLLSGVVRYLLGGLLPLRAWLEGWLARPPRMPEVTGGQALLVCVIAAVEIWQLVVWIRILRRSLEVPVAGSVLILMLLVLVSVIAGALVTGAAGAA